MKVTRIDQAWTDNQTD